MDDFRFSNTSLEELRIALSEFARERDWEQYHTPRNLCLALVGEVGELCEIFQWTPDSSLTERLKDWPEERKVHLEEELSDVLCYLIRLADRCGVDLPAACLRKIAKNAKKYPVHLAKGSSKKYSELNDSAESQNESNN